MERKRTDAVVGLRDIFIAAIIAVELFLVEVV